MGCVSSKSLGTSSNVSYTHTAYELASPPARSESCLPGPPPSRLEPYHQGLIGAARWPDDAPGLNVSNKSHTPENMAYCRSMHKATRSGGQLIADGRIDSFDALWKYATQWRVSALRDRDPHRIAFASERVDGTRFVTVLRSPYQSVRDRVLNHDEANTEVLNHQLLGEVGVKTYRQHGNIHGVVIPMNTISTATDEQSMRNLMSQLITNQGRDEANKILKNDHPNRIEHTNACYLPMIKVHLNELFSQAMNPSLNRNELIDLVARIHWWAASAAPDQRGSAAKAEFVARSIAHSHGIELSPFRHGKVPDIEAMLMSEEQFVESYLTLLEYEPH
ncbi:MAG: XopAH/AvrB family type III secretion system effector [Exilibacterium sp.]